MPKPKDNSRAALDRHRTRVAKQRKADRAIAKVAVQVVAEYQQGRAASACMADLLQKAKEITHETA